MSFGILETADVIEKMQNYLDRERPPVEMRPQLDISYRIEGQSIIIFEIRPHLLDPQKVIESPYAKTTYIKANHWKVFWMRGNLEWYPYKPATVNTLEEFLKLVDDDEMGCFKG